MRYFKIFIIGFLIIAGIQIGMLTFLEKAYLVDNAAYSSTKVSDSVSSQVDKSKLILESGSSNITTSSDGKYIAYLKDRNLQILNSENNDKISVPADENMKISYYKWVYDRSRLILAERPINSENQTYFKLYYYDVENNSKAEIYNGVNNKKVKIPVYSGSDNITAIEMSTLTNIIYVKVTNSYNESTIYKINIMAQQEQVDTVNQQIGKIVSTKKDDVLFYQSLTSDSVYKQGSDLPVKIDGHTNFSLLGVDEKDNVYLALTNSDIAQAVYYGSFSTGVLHKVILNQAININNLYVNFNGSVYVKDDKNSQVYDLLTGAKTTLNGNFIDMYNDGIISVKNNEIIKTSF